MYRKKYFLNYKKNYKKVHELNDFTHDKTKLQNQ